MSGESDHPRILIVDDQETKGSTANMGATAFADLCATLESIGLTGNLDGAATLLAEVERRGPMVVAAIEAVLPTVVTGPH